MKRVAAVLALWLCSAVPTLAQDRSTLPLVAMLRVNTADTVEPGNTFFRNALGIVDGRNIRPESRLDEGHLERLPDLARTLVTDKPSNIVPFGEAATRAAKQATGTMPIVTISDDLVASELIATLAKPGGNGQHPRDRTRCEEDRPAETDATVGPTVRGIAGSFEHQCLRTDAGNRRDG
jgi:ABC-type uncharacterized transport system substrate-binding protein